MPIRLCCMSCMFKKNCKKKYDMILANDVSQKCDSFKEE